MFLEEAMFILDKLRWQSEGVNLPFGSPVFSLASFLFSVLGNSILSSLRKGLRACNSTHEDRIIVHRSLAGVVSLGSRRPHFPFIFSLPWALCLFLFLSCKILFFLFYYLRILYMCRIFFDQVFITWMNCITWIVSCLGKYLTLWVIVMVSEKGTRLMEHAQCGRKFSDTFFPL